MREWWPLAPRDNASNKEDGESREWRGENCGCESGVETRSIGSRKFFDGNHVKEGIMVAL